MENGALCLVKGNREMDKCTSNTLKGILIILIVIGHNYLLAKNIDGLYEYLYSFHVMLFFILPWFYKRKTISVHNSVSRCVKLYMYYLVFFVIQIILYNLLIEQNFSLKESIYAFFRGGHYALKAVTGYQYLWFLPSFCISMIFYDIYVYHNAYLSKIGQTLFNILAFIVVLVFIIVPYQKCNALIQGLYFASMSVVTVILYNHIFRHLNKVVPILLFVIMSILVYIEPTRAYIIPLMPFIAFIALWNVGEWLSKRSQIFATIGKLSLLIYLIHPLVFQFLIRIIPTLSNTNQIIYGMVILICTLVVTIIVSWIIDQILSKLFGKNAIKSSKTS